MLADNLDPTSAASDQILYVSLGPNPNPNPNPDSKVSPNGVDALPQVMGGCRHMLHRIHFWGNVAPYMFYGVHVCRHARPRQDISCSIQQEGNGKPDSVWWSLVLLEVGPVSQSMPIDVQLDPWH